MGGGGVYTNLKPGASYKFFKRIRSEDLGLAQLALSHGDERNRIFCVGSCFRDRGTALENWMVVVAAKSSEPRRDGALPI